MPFNHTGALFTLHAKSWLDLLGGVTRGVNTSLDDNNDSVGFLAGFGLNLNGGKLLVNAATHIGPETPNDNHDLRYLSDITRPGRSPTNGPRSPNSISRAMMALMPTDMA